MAVKSGSLIGRQSCLKDDARLEVGLRSQNQASPRQIPARIEPLEAAL
jgi:hypothetical protein